ncbi:unnamed protein product [Strongylus vulgaris]|uniref:Uncharacterized protein n=1 Tax=Strongylus vulgaris TaxID=40348 RepID=A0A3P7KUJ9_STRVU|nr:unnamed protein product [Strongylus vulgaris]
MVEFIATEFPQAINLPDQAGRAPIHYAAAQPNAIYDTLIDLGADPRITDTQLSRTCLRYITHEENRLSSSCNTQTAVGDSMTPVIKNIHLASSFIAPSFRSTENFLIK